MNKLVDKSILSKFIDKLTTGQVKGKGLSSNDFTDEYKEKLSNLSTDILYKGNDNQILSSENGIPVWNDKISNLSIEFIDAYYNSIIEKYCDIVDPDMDESSKEWLKSIAATIEAKLEHLNQLGPFVEACISYENENNTVIDLEYALSEEFSNSIYIEKGYKNFNAHIYDKYISIADLLTIIKSYVPTKATSFKDGLLSNVDKKKLDTVLTFHICASKDVYDNLTKDSNTLYIITE